MELGSKESKCRHDFIFVVVLIRFFSDSKVDFLRRQTSKCTSSHGLKRQKYTGSMSQNAFD